MVGSESVTFVLFQNLIVTEQLPRSMVNLNSRLLCRAWRLRVKLHRKSISKLLSFALAATGFLAPMIMGAQLASADTTVKPWSALGKSLDGSKLIAGTWGQGLFISSDSGTSWIQVTPDTSTATNASPSTNISSRCYSPFLWTAVAISNDGQTLAAGSWGCGLWVSTDGGVSWRQRSTTISGSNPINNNWKWYSVALSADASKVYAVNNYTKVEAGYTNSSAALTQLTYSASGSNVGSCSQDLTQIYVVPDGDIYAKNNGTCLFKVAVNIGGGTYGQIFYNPNGSTNFWLGAIDVVNTGDSFTVYASQGNQASGKIAVSRDGGTSWTLLSNAPSKLWLRISASSDGRKIIGIASYSTEQFLKSTTYSHLWISTDSGNTWTSPDSGTSARHHWSDAKVLPDGSFIAVDGQETPLYLVSPNGTSSAWNPAPTVTGSIYSAPPVPYTGNIWRSNSSGSNWVIADPTFFGGPAGRATLGASETSTVIYDPDQTLGKPKLIFASAAPGATVTVTPTTDPTSGTGSPFIVGARLLDIAVAGVTGDTQICVDGTISERMWHYRSNAWEDITTSHTLTQVCGTTSSFSPFAIGAARAAGQDSSSAANAAREARQREIEKARNEIRNSLASKKTLTVDQLLRADFNGVTTKNLELINAEIAKLTEEYKQDLQQIEKIVLKYATVDKVAQKKTYSSYDLVSVGLIPKESKIKTSILSALKKLPGSDLDTYEKIQAVVASVEKKEVDRKARLATILAKKR